MDARAIEVLRTGGLLTGKELEAEARRLLDALPWPAIAARDDGTPEFANAVWNRFLSDCTADDEFERAWIERAHPDDMAELVERWRACVATGAPLQHVYRLRCAEDAYRWVQVELYPITGANGLVHRWIGIVPSVDRLKREELAFEELAQALGQIAWIADARGEVVWYNERWYEYTGQTPERAAQWGWQAVFTPDDLTAYVERCALAASNVEGFSMEVRLRDASGGFRWFLMRTTPVKGDDGGVARWYGTFTDIHEQRLQIERSTHVASTLQHAFLPDKLPNVPQLRFDAVYIPAEKHAFVGGDWYDVFVLPDRRIMATIGDVAGHGLHAAVTAGRMRQSILGASLVAPNPGLVLSHANRVLRYQDETIVTALAIVIDYEDEALTYASAGHPPAIVVEPDGAVRMLDAVAGAPLGVLGDMDLRTARVPFKKDSVLVLYTDGVTEFARDIDEAERRLIEAARALVANPAAAEPADAMLRAVFRGANPPDDAALVVVQFTPPPRTEHAATGAPVEKTWRFHSSDAETAAAARAQLVAFLHRIAPNESGLFESELVLGEILANAVKHAPGLVRVDLDWRGEYPVVRVRDTGPGIGSASPHLPDPMDEGGRGMFLIRSLAQAVDVRRSSDGTNVEVILPVRRRLSGQQ